MQKLLDVVIDSVKDFVRITLNALVLFYQLDVVSTETTDICLYNLLLSMALKNPIYSQIRMLLTRANIDTIKLIERELEKGKGRKGDMARVLGIDEVDIGRWIMGQGEEKEESGEEETDKVDRKRCREVFEKSLNKIAFVKNHSSPTAKIEYINKVFQELTPG